MSGFSQAERLWLERGIKSPHEINLEILAWTLGATVKTRRLESCEAKIIGLNDKAIITIDDRYGVRRAKYSLGHEIGHWQCHRNQTLSCTKQDIGLSHGARSAKERQADRFAADLLMPRFMFRPRIAGYDRASFSAVCELEEEFDVSRKAAALRFVDLFPGEAMLICFGPSGRKWYRGSPSWPGNWAPLKDYDEDNDALDILLERKALRSKPELAPASAYFGSYRAKECEVFVHHTKSKSGEGQLDREVLTLITPRSSDMFSDNEW